MNAFDDVIDFEICDFHQNAKIYMDREQRFFFSKKKN